MPLVELFPFVSRAERHPALYFFVLHFVELFSQSERAVRLPAAVAGALLGPALVAAVWRIRGSVGPAALLAALAVTVSPELIQRSREVSEIPLFALLAIGMATSLATDGKSSVIVTHALALWTIISRRW